MLLSCVVYNYIIVLWVQETAAEKGPVGLVQPGCCPLGLVELQGGKEKYLFPESSWEAQKGKSPQHVVEQGTEGS